MTTLPSSPVSPLPDDGIGSRPVLRLSSFYGAYFAGIGVHLPFWPLWLASRDLAPSEIGIVMATPLVVRLVGNPIIARIVDRTGRRKETIIGLSFGTVLFFLCFSLVEGFWPILGITVLVGFMWSPMLPVSENLALLTAYARKLDYGRIRLWGSITFMAGSVAGGLLLANRPESIILWSIFGTLAATFLTSLALPSIRVERRLSEAPLSLGGLLLNPIFILFLMAAGFAQSSHSVYYGFSALSWRSAGISETWIGILWAVGVLAEIVVFSMSNALVRRFSPTGLLTIAAVAGIVRWGLTPLTDVVALLVPLQLLHGLSFGAGHVGAMHFIARSVSPQVSGSAQSLYYSMALGLIQGAAIFSSGQLYGRFGPDSYFAMMAMSAIGLVLGLILAKRWSGGEIVFAPAIPARSER